MKSWKDSLNDSVSILPQRKYLRDEKEPFMVGRCLTAFVAPFPLLPMDQSLDVLFVLKADKSGRDDRSGNNGL